MLEAFFLTLVDTLGGLLTGVLLARFVMQWQRIFAIPSAKVRRLLTDWLVLPCASFIPGPGGLDLASRYQPGSFRCW